MRSQLLIMGLHRIGTPPPDAKIRGLFSTPKLLEFQLGFLRRMGFQFTTLKNALADPRGKRAVLTFDDGYLDNNGALEVLERFNAPATIFVITGDVGKKKLVWDEAGDKLPSDMMDWDGLLELKRRGWEIGSHAHEHIHLARYDRDKQEEAIRRSIEVIADHTGMAPVSFAYPYGSYNDTTVELLTENGIKYAVTTNAPSSVGPIKDLELGRVPLGGRKSHHYLKTVMRTAKAVGKIEMFQSLVRNPVVREELVFRVNHDVLERQ